MSKKQSVLIGLRERVEATFKNCLSDMFKKFKGNQGIFQGERRTYVANIEGGYHDEPTKRGERPVQSTVKDQLSWLESTAEEFMKTVFSIEKTNASGRAKAELIVDGVSWGEFSSLELLRLKTTLDNSMLKEMYEHLPVRNNDIWKITDDSAYEGKAGIYSTPLEENTYKTTKKRKFILHDPHAAVGGRPPIEGSDDIVEIMGTGTVQRFSGEISLYERAMFKVRYDKLYAAVLEALEHANNIEAETSDLGVKMFKYLHQ